MLRCMNTTDNMLLEPQHETSLSPQIPWMVNHFAKLWTERNKCHDLSRHPPSRPRSSFVIPNAAVGYIQLCLPACVGLRASHRTLLCCVWTAVGSESVSSLLIFHQPALGLDVTMARQWLASWQENKRVCSSSKFDLHQLNNAETSNVLQKAVLLTRHTQRWSLAPSRSSPLSVFVFLIYLCLFRFRISYYCNNNYSCSTSFLFYLWK